MDVSVIIVNYNTHDFLEDCLRSITEFTKDIEYEIIVVDNNSTIKGIDKIGDKFGSVKFLFNKENNGFGAGCNIGIKNASGKYCAFVNPDIVFTENCLSKFYEYMEINTDTGACGGRLVNNENKTIYTFNYFPGYLWEILQATGKGSDNAIAKLNKKLLSSEKEYYEVDWLIGAFMFIRKEIIDKLKGFDEMFFLYYEDVDIQFRIKELGFKIVCLKNIQIKHHERSSIKTSQDENVYHIHMHKSKILYMKKHFNFFKRNIITFMHITGILMRMILLPVRDRFSGNKEQKSYQYKKMLALYFNSEKANFTAKI